MPDRMVAKKLTIVSFSTCRATVVPYGRQWMFDRITGEASGNGGQGSLGAGDPFGGIGESVIQQFVPLQKVRRYRTTVGDAYWKRGCRRECPG